MLLVKITRKDCVTTSRDGKSVLNALKASACRSGEQAHLRPKQSTMNKSLYMFDVKE